MKLNEAIERLADMVDEDGSYRIPQADREALVIVLRAAKMQLHGVCRDPRRVHRLVAGVAMTGDELAAKLLEEQGYLVHAEERKLPLGFVISPQEFAYLHSTPVRVVGKSSLKKYHQQCQRAHEIAPECAGGPPFDTWPNFYRVEAAD